MFDIIRMRKIWYTISLAVIIPGLLFLVYHFVTPPYTGLNLGIDYTGGTSFNLKFDKKTSIQDLRSVLNPAGLSKASIQQAEGSNTFYIRTKELSEKQQKDLMENFKKKLGKVEVLSISKIGGVIGKELGIKALLSLLVASVLMVIYITVRFEFLQGLAAIMALLHDVLVVIGVFAIFQIEVDSAFIAAILTIIGYSINDTIVIFDRIRENLKGRKKGEELEDLVNKSIWQTMTRSINTVLTVLMVTVALLIFGGASLKNFMLALLIGISSGAYSSIFNASPLWVTLRKMSGDRAKVAKARA